MKLHAMGTWLSAVLLAAAPVGPLEARPQIVYEQNFDKGAAGWEPFLGYWRLNDKQWHWSATGGLEGGCLMHEAALGVKEPGRGAHDALIIYRTHQLWKDYSFEADAKAGAGRCGMWFRARMRSSGAKDGRYVAGYMFVVDPRRGSAVLWRARRDEFDKDGRWRTNHFSNPVEIRSAKLARRPGDEWLRIKVIARGSLIQCFVNDEKIIEATDDTFSYGSVGFTAYKAPEARFDNVRVTVLGPPRDR